MLVGRGLSVQSAELRALKKFSMYLRRCLNWCHIRSFRDRKVPVGIADAESVPNKTVQITETVSS